MVIHKLPSPPAVNFATTTGPGQRSVWTGTEIVYLGGLFVTTPVLMVRAFNPTTNTWRLLADVPAEKDGASAVWTGTHVLIHAGTFLGVPGYKLDPAAAGSQDIYVQTSRTYHQYRKD